MGKRGKSGRGGEEGGNGARCTREGDLISELRKMKELGKGKP